MTTTRAGFLRGLFALGANLAGNGVGFAAAESAMRPYAAGTNGIGPNGMKPNDMDPASAAHQAPFLSPAPLCGPGGDFTPELLRLEAERMGLPADADGNDVVRRLHQAMLDMAPPRAPEADETAAHQTAASQAADTQNR